jgi:hypothetical protein
VPGNEVIFNIFFAFRDKMLIFFSRGNKQYFREHEDGLGRHTAESVKNGGGGTVPGVVKKQHLWGKLWQVLPK